MVFLLSQTAFAQITEADLESEFNDEINAASEPEAADLSIEEPVPEPQVRKNDGVVIEKFRDVTQPYRERRNTFGKIFSLNYENFYPHQLISPTQSSPYVEYYDEYLPLVGFEFGVKYNIGYGSMTGLVGYSMVNAKDPDFGVDDISLSIMKVAINLSLDGIFSEPYVAPYIQAGMHRLSFSETGRLSGQSESVSFEFDNYHIKTGLSFQLNWIERSIDSSSQEDSLRSGLENTYIDLFYTQYLAPREVTLESGEVVNSDLQSSQYGAGLKIEF